MCFLTFISFELIPLDPELERTLRNLRISSRTIRPIPQMANPPRELKEYFTPTAYTSPSCIELPNVAAEHFEIKSSTIQMLPSFYGRTNEDPYNHLDEFLGICTTIKLQHFTDDALKLRLFPFSLKDKAKHWLSSLAPNSIKSWAQLQKEFLKKYFSIGKTHQIRKAITSFSQNDGEQFFET